MVGESNEHERKSASGNYRCCSKNFEGRILLRPRNILCNLLGNLVQHESKGL